LNGQGLIERHAVREIARHDLAATCVNTIRYPNGFACGRSIDRVLNVRCSRVPRSEWGNVTACRRHEMISRKGRDGAQKQNRE
jgi:hypothetical protein